MEFCFFNPTHLHTHVLGFHNHHYAQGIQCFLDAFFNLECHAFLHLKTVGEDIHYTGNLAQPRNVTGWDIGHVCFP